MLAPMNGPESATTAGLAASAATANKRPNSLAVVFKSIMAKPLKYWSNC
jgi:hypothetical protein